MARATFRDDTAVEIIIISFNLHLYDNGTTLSSLSLCYYIVVIIIYHISVAAAAAHSLNRHYTHIYEYRGWAPGDSSHYLIARNKVYIHDDEDALYTHICDAYIDWHFHSFFPTS